jgi:hypothetical protein
VGADDRASAIDWPQSTLTNFSPLIVRDFEQPSTAHVVAVADRRCRRCASTACRCGGDCACHCTIGMSAILSGSLPSSPWTPGSIIWRPFGPD